MSGINPHFIKIAVDELVKTQDSIIKKSVSEEVGNIIIQHALGAAAAGLGAAWIPGAGGTAALAASVGVIWLMYYRINKALGIKLSKTLLKSLASAVITNIAASAASVIGGTVTATALSFIPGVGNGAASVVMAGVDYAVVFASGLVYIKILTNLFKAGKNPEEMSADELKAAAKSAVKNEDMSKIVREAKKEYTNARKSGDVSGKETIDREE